MPTDLFLGLAPIAVVHAIIGGRGTRMMIQARQQQVSPSRAAWVLWGTGWGVTFAVLTVLLIAVALEMWHGLTDGTPLVTISVPK